MDKTAAPRQSSETLESREVLRESTSRYWGAVDRRAAAMPALDQS